MGDKVPDQLGVTDSQTNDRCKTVSLGSKWCLLVDSASDLM